MNMNFPLDDFVYKEIQMVLSQNIRKKNKIDSFIFGHVP